MILIRVSIRMGWRSVGMESIRIVMERIRFVVLIMMVMVCLVYF